MEKVGGEEKWWESLLGFFFFFLAEHYLFPWDNGEDPCRDAGLFPSNTLGYGAKVGGDGGRREFPKT